MPRTAKLLAPVAALIVWTTCYTILGWSDARRDSAALAARANSLIANNRGSWSLGYTRRNWLLRVQDPGFQDHNGVDLGTPGAGITTITQSLAKRVAFDAFKPGYHKLRQTSYALGLEQTLNKEQIFALFLDTVSMGKGPDGWIRGFHRASEEIFEQPPSSIEEDDYLALLAVMIAPGKLRLSQPDPALQERVSRIRRLTSDQCEPRNTFDVWLLGCA